MANGDDASEPNTVVSINPYLFHCCKRCARRRGQMRCLPQEMFFKILLHLPAQVVHNVMKHVCREWNLMIRTKDFIQHHLRNSTCGVIIQDFYLDRNDTYQERHRNAIYVEMRRGCLEICKFDSGFEYLLWTSCNGLTVIPDLRDSNIYYVTNPLTKQRAILPPNSSDVGYYSNFGVAFVEACVEYKVVYACKKPYGQLTKIAVLTIGVDRVWRHIDIGHLSVTDNRRSVPLVTGGYAHWISTTFVLTLNLESETISWFPMPPFPKLYGKFLPMGCFLSFLYKTSEFTRDVWEMNPETGDWTMILSIDLEPLRSNFKNLCCENVKSIIPFGWLAFREVLLFSTGCMQTTCVAYNVNTREIQSFELGNNLKHYRFQAHVNSLVWLEE